MGATAFREAVAAVTGHLGVCVETASTRELMEQLDSIEVLARMLPALRHERINQLAACATRQELGGSLKVALAERLRIDRSEAARRIHEAADLGARRALTGEPLPPKLEATAAAQGRGLIEAEHVRIIRGFMDRLPDAVDAAAAEEAE